MGLSLLILSISIGIPVIDTPSYSVSLTDALVAFLLPPALFIAWYKKTKIKLTIPDWGMSFFVIFLTISLISHLGQGIFLSVLGLTRMVMFYILARLLIGLNGKSTGLVLNKAFTGIIYLTVGTGVLGLLLFVFGISNPFILVREYYYGLVPIQLSGLDGHPNGAAQIIFVSAIIVFFTRSDQNKIPWMSLWVALTGLLLTQAKSNLLYLGVLISVYSHWSDFPLFKRRLGYILSSGLILGYLMISHWFPVNNQSAEARISAYLDTSGVLLKRSSFTVYSTYYTTNKIAAWTCFTDYPLMGIGPRNYLPYIDSLQKAGAYPAACRFKNPHCMYTGILAKFGIIGLFGLMVLFFSIIITIKKIPVSGMKILFTALMTVFIFDGWTADMEYNKVMWFVVAWIAGLYSGADTLSSPSHPPLPRNQKQQAT